jgi:dynein heavy chain
MQLKECKDTRHGNMLIGSTMSGKTTCWSVLAEALNRLNKEEKEEKESHGRQTQEVKYD